MQSVRFSRCSSESGETRVVRQDRWWMVRCWQCSISRILASSSWAIMHFSFGYHDILLHNPNCGILHLWIWTGLGSVGRMLLNEWFTHKLACHLFRDFVDRERCLTLSFGVWVNVALMSGSVGCEFPFPKRT